MSLLPSDPGSWRWERLGPVWLPNSGDAPARRVSFPTPLVLERGLVRVFYTLSNEDLRGLPFYFDLDLGRDSPRVCKSSSNPLVQLGEPGTFDHDGVVFLSLLRHNNDSLSMYYAGFERLRSVDHRIMIGLARSANGGLSFNRFMSTPILDRRPGESLFRAGSFVFQDSHGYHMLYAGGEGWKRMRDKERPEYSLRLVHSRDGVCWGDSKVVLEANERFFGIGRPWLVEATDEQRIVVLSVRDAEEKRYRMAWVTFGEDWTMMNFGLGIGLEPGLAEGESHDTVFPVVFKAEENFWCLYNGDGMGESGIFLAKLKSS